jgi:hypothetical protein
MLFALRAVSDAGEDAGMDALITCSPTAFLSDLKPDRPSLSLIRKTAAEGDTESALRLLGRRFRTLGIATPLLRDWQNMPRDASYSTARADAILAGHFIDGYNVYEVPETGLDWKTAPLTCLTRFPIFPTLQFALHHTRDSRYLRFMVDHLNEYMAAYPMAAFVDHRDGGQGWIDDTTVARPWHWCMYCNRISRMAEMLEQLRHYEGITDGELGVVLYRLYRETAYMRREMKVWVDRRHNGGCAMIRAMIQACAVLDDFRVADTWLEYDAGMLAQYIETSFYPDGACVELTTAYSLSVARSVQGMAHAMGERAGLGAAVGRLRAIPEWIIGLGKPTGRLPSFGDLYAGAWRPSLDPDFLRAFGRSDLADFAEGVVDVPPMPLVWPAPGAPQWCGYYSMRSDWSPDALYLAVDAGPWGTTHSHADKLSFVLTAYGQDFIIDPTSTKYRNNEADAFISTQKPGFLHNTITVDGVDEFINSPKEAAEPLANRWEHGEGRTVFEGQYTFAPVKPVNWTRRILFGDRRWWVLEDRLESALDSAEIEQNFQFDADVSVSIEEGRVVATGANGARLLLIPSPNGPQRPVVTTGDTTAHTTYWPSGKPRTDDWAPNTQQRSHGRGWTGRGGRKLIPAPALTFTGRIPFPATITVLLYPLAPGEEEPTATALATMVARVTQDSDR